MTIKKKIILSVALIVSIALLLSGTTTYSYVSNVLIEQVKKDEAAKLKQKADQLQFIQNDLEQFAQYILVDEDIQFRIQKMYSAQDQYEKLTNQNWLTRKLNSYLLLKNYIDSVILVSNDETVITSSLINQQYHKTILKEEWFTNFLKREIYGGFSDVHLIKNNQRSTKVVSYIIRYNRQLNPESKLNYLIINFNLSHLSSMMGETKRDYEDFYLLNSEDSVLLSIENQPASITSILENNKQKTNYIVESHQRIISVNQDMKDQWKVVSVRSKETLLHKVDFIFYFITGVTLLSIVLIMLIVTPIIVNLSKPISSLTKAMKSVSQGELQTAVSITSKDEFQLLGDGFNRMVSELRKYIDKSIEDEQIKQRLQMDLLLSQINPHFIYNTLNTVIYMGQREGNTDIVKIVGSFISLLQDTIRTGEDAYFATIKEEVEQVKNYIVIQHFRYPNRFYLDWQVDLRALDEQVPRTIIQPLVENAIIHGVIPADEFGTIIVRITLGTHLVIIEIEDDGMGIDADRLEELNWGQDVFDSTGMKSIGLANVRDRILHTYGEHATMTIDSELYKGTKIRIQIPKSTPDFIQ
jgi:two-component system, sensor histidine kinase YesM